MAFQRVVLTGEESPITEVVTVNKGPDDYEIRDTELVVHVKAGALNPVDYKMQLMGIGSKGTAVGSDYAGIVYKVGSKVNGLKVGDFVSGFIHGSFDPQKESGSLQEYTVVQSATVIKYSKLVELNKTGSIAEGKIDSFESAASIGVGLLTAGQVLYQGFQLRGRESEGKWILIWGGTTSTGFMAIQVAKKVFGLKVITVANKEKYGARLESIGADIVVNYKSADTISEIKRLTNDSVVYALDAVSETPESFKDTYDALSNSLPSKISNLNGFQIAEFEKVEKKDTQLSLAIAFLLSGDDLDAWGVKSSPEIVRQQLEFVKIITPFLENGDIFHLPLTIYDGKLESANQALLDMKKGVSFTKLVVHV